MNYYYSDKDPPFFRLLLIEDSPERWNWFLEHTPDNVKLSTFSSGQVAIGVINRITPEFQEYSGLLLDCDLDEHSPTGDYYSGVDIAFKIVERIPRSTPILLHSHSREGAARMLIVLKSNGFEVSQIPFRELTPEVYADWLKKVEEEVKFRLDEKNFGPRSQ